MFFIYTSSHHVYNYISLKCLCVACSHCFSTYMFCNQPMRQYLLYFVVFNPRLKEKKKDSFSQVLYKVILMYSKIFIQDVYS